jgi:hypothetical protein
VIKKRPRKYKTDIFYYIKNKATFAFFNNGFVYFHTKEDKNSFLDFAKIIEGSMNLGVLSVGVSNVDRWIAHKQHLGFTFDLKKITYEKI